MVEIVNLSDIRRARARRPVRAIKSLPIPDIHTLERALAIMELAIKWNVDLALVAEIKAIRDSTLK